MKNNALRSQLYHNICEITNLLIYNKSWFPIYTTGSHYTYRIRVFALYRTKNQHCCEGISNYGDGSGHKKTNVFQSYLLASTGKM